MKVWLINLLPEILGTAINYRYFSVKEVKKILDLALELKAEGIGVIMITHNLHHMFSVADRVTVLEHGAQVGNKKIKDTNIKEIENLIIGEHEED